MMPLIWSCYVLELDKKPKSHSQKSGSTMSIKKNVIYNLVGPYTPDNLESSA